MHSQFFTFQRDDAPAHGARETVELLSRTPDCIAPSMWLPSSSDMNPVDYQAWGVRRVRQQHVYQHRIYNVEHLKHHLIEEWYRFPQGVITH